MRLAAAAPVSIAGLMVDAAQTVVSSWLRPAWWSGPASW
jgi:hypothetical protein